MQAAAGCLGRLAAAPGKAPYYQTQVQAGPVPFGGDRACCFAAQGIMG